MVRLSYQEYSRLVRYHAWLSGRHIDFIGKYEFENKVRVLRDGELVVKDHLWFDKGMYPGDLMRIADRKTLNDRFVEPHGNPAFAFQEDPKLGQFNTDL